MDFVSFAKGKVSKAAVPIKVVPMTADYVAFWHQSVQPFVNAAAVSRADKRWRWSVLYMVTRIMPRFGGYCITVPGPGGESIPAGMLVVVRDYPWLRGRPYKSSFLWFLASAPDNAMTALGVTDPPSLGRTLVDTGVVDSFRSGHEGRIGLHAAPKGGPRLFDFYKNICKLLNLNKSSKLPVGLAGFKQALVSFPVANDGRFFYTDKGCVTTFVAVWSDWR